TALDPEQSRRVSFYQRERKLFGTALVDGQGNDPITVKLEPLGTVTGRFLNKDGTPAEGLRIDYYCRDYDDTELFLNQLNVHRSSLQSLGARCDCEGRFRIDSVAHSLPIVLLAYPSSSKRTPQTTLRMMLRPGEMSDIGTIKSDPSLQ